MGAPHGTLLDDLEALPPDRWCVVDHSALVNDPEREVERMCDFVGIEAEEEVTRPLRALRDQVAAERSEPAPRRGRRVH